MNKTTACLITIIISITGCVSPWAWVPDAESLSTVPGELKAVDLDEPVYIGVNRIVHQNQEAKNHSLGNLFTDKLIKVLIDDKNFRVISRTQVERILNEQKFGLSGLVDPETAAKLGRIAGVRAIIIGSATLSYHKEEGLPLKFVKVDVELRVVDTETAELIESTTSSGYEEYDYQIKEEDVIRAVDRAVKAVHVDIHNSIVRWYSD